MVRPILFRVATLSMTILLASSGSFAAPDDRTKPDNSAANRRDASITEVTAQNQSTAIPAFETTRKIRAELTTDSNLSTYAKNVKVIVVGDLITLKGPVTSEAERIKIARVANSVAPEYKIENQIQVVK